MDKNPLGIFIIPDEHLVTRLNAAKSLDIPTAQVLTPPQGERTAEKQKELLQLFKDASIEITILFCGFEGESYDSIQKVEETVGLAPADTFESRFQECIEIADFAKSMNIPAIGMHIGFIPEKIKSETFTRLVDATQKLCDYCGERNMRVHLETGQEKAKILLNFIESVNRENLAVNFDPANMILYGAGEPLSALRLLGNYVKSVHIKDALWAKDPGKEWGTEVLAGTGDVLFQDFFRTLFELDYKGTFTIEREIAGEEQIKDIRKTVDFVKELKDKFKLPE